MFFMPSGLPKNGQPNPGWIKKGSISKFKGKKHTDETRKKMSEVVKRAFQKMVHPQYIDGRSSNKAYRDFQKNQWHHRNRSATGSHTFGEWENLKAQYNWTCPCCGGKEPDIKLTLDHVIPLSKGGSNNIENIQPLCKSCNCKKLTKIIKY